jgi:hypothetical protein
MNSDRRAILALVAMGRVTPGQAERLIAAWNDSRETEWILAASLAFAVLAQLHVHELVPGLVHFLDAIHHALSSITDLIGGLL